MRSIELSVDIVATYSGNKSKGRPKSDGSQCACVWCTGNVKWNFFFSLIQLSSTE